ncbi:nuclease-related domain-containing protein [Pseudoneobacillus sp. C159]
MSSTIILEPHVKKTRSPNLQLEGYTAALSRLSEYHPVVPILSSQQSSLQAGIGGEKRVAHELARHTFLMDHHIFYDLSLSYSSLYQMDALFLTRYFALLLEVKNISGTLKFLDNPPQLIQTKDNGEIKGYDSPAAQVERYGDLLSLWLTSRNISLPIYRAVVLAYPTQKVERAPAKTPVLFPSLIFPYIQKLPRDQIRLDIESFHWLSNELVTNHQFFIPKPICELYHFPSSDIRPGVICPDCQYIGMIKTKRSWLCPRCDCHNHLAHLPTMKEWFLIMGRKMTNADCREFLQVDMKTATRILSGMDLMSEGGKKNRYYMMNFEEILRSGKW